MYCLSNNESTGTKKSYFNDFELRMDRITAGPSNHKKERKTVWVNNGVKDQINTSN